MITYISLFVNIHTIYSFCYTIHSCSNSLMKRPLSLFFIVIAITFAAGLTWYYWPRQETSPAPLTLSETAKAEEQDREVRLEIHDGDTLAGLGEEAGISAQEVNTVVDASKNIYNLTSIRAGKSILFTFDHETN